MEVVVTTGAIIMQSSSQIITTNKPTPSSFYRPDALPVAQPTVSKHCLCHLYILYDHQELRQIPQAQMAF